MKTSVLLTPGPTCVPEPVLAALAQPIIHHRTDTFKTLFERVQTRLQELFCTSEKVLPLSGSGTAAMEAAVVNLFSRSETVIVLNGGKFGKRWAEISNSFGLNVEEILIQPGSTFETSQLVQALKKHPTARAVLFQASETSTGLEFPVREIAEICKKHNVLSVCDGITACGVFELPMKDWGLDALMTGSQKSLMLPPGLALISFSENAWKANQEANLPRYYFDLAQEKKASETNQTAYTPAISLMVGLDKSLDLIFREGLGIRFERFEKMAIESRAAFERLGLHLVSPSRPSRAVTAAWIPQGIDGNALIKNIERNHNVLFAGGQDDLSGKIIRMAHFGSITPQDLHLGLVALEKELRNSGFALPSPLPSEGFLDKFKKEIKV